MHRCAASCCENETYSIQKVHNCVENCSTTLHKAQQYVQGEFDRVQVSVNIFNLVIYTKYKESLIILYN